VLKTKYIVLYYYFILHPEQSRRVVLIYTSTIIYIIDYNILGLFYKGRYSICKIDRVFVVERFINNNMRSAQTQTHDNMRCDERVAFYSCRGRGGRTNIFSH